jgi:hypothetical protein
MGTEPGTAWLGWGGGRLMGHCLPQLGPSHPCLPCLFCWASVWASQAFLPLKTQANGSQDAL